MFQSLQVKGSYQHNAENEDGVMEVKLYSFTSTIGGGEWSASCSGPFTPGERALVLIGEESR
jgi:hypothetical protein